MPHPDPIQRARELRRSMTPAEVILWRELRGRRFSNFKFRRQRPLGPFVVDFFCHDCSIIIELDGDSHVGREAADAERQARLEACGYKVLRFWNPEIYDELESVLETIYWECDRRVKRQGT